MSRRRCRRPLRRTQRRSGPPAERSHPCALGDAGRAGLRRARPRGRALSFRQLEGSMERWRALLGGAHARGLTTVGLAISDPLAFTAAFIGAMAAGLLGGAARPGHARDGGGWPGGRRGAHRGRRGRGGPPRPGRRRAATGSSSVASTASTPGRSRGRVRRHPSAPAPGASSCRRRARRVRPRSSGWARTSCSTRRAAWRRTSQLDSRRPRLQPAAALPHQRGGRGPAVRRWSPAPAWSSTTGSIGPPSGSSWASGRSRGSTRSPPSSRASAALRPGRDGPGRHPLHPLGVGAAAGGDGRPVRGGPRGSRSSRPTG